MKTQKRLMSSCVLFARDGFVCSHASLCPLHFFTLLLPSVCLSVCLSVFFNFVPQLLSSSFTMSFSLQSPEFFYASIHRDFHLSDVFDVLLFTDALDQLVG